MARTPGTDRICGKGHRYRKSSDCPVCPVCEAEAAPEEGFLAPFAAPVRRALTHAGITTPQELARHTSKDILKLHGIGPSSIPKMKAMLDEAGLSFKEEPGR
ncbi:RNA polymerase alpha subunit C-terminal domain-containing protein [Shouchella clausii]